MNTIPAAIAVFVVAGAVAIASAIWTMAALAAPRADLPPGAVRRVRAGSGLFLAAWLGVTLLFSPRSAPASAPAGFDPTSMIVYMLLGSMLLTLLLVACSPSLRRTLAAIPLGALHAVQVWRVLGVTFIVLLAEGRLPAHFALPAGWGDIFVGITAPLVALALARHTRGSRALAVAWNVFGLVDLVVAVGMGSGILAGHAPPAAPMGALPMILVPAFGVPASAMIHVLALRRLTHGAGVHAVPGPAPARA